MNHPQQLYIDLRTTDRLIAECRHQLECQYRLIAGLRRQRGLAWRERLHAREMEKRMSALCVHRDALIQAVAAVQKDAAETLHGNGRDAE